jgi:tRNA (cytidine/uridine-2'-O-)-methyltransferase
MDVVLVRPEIPQNTGSIARTCAATRTPLHIVGPIPFEISDRTVRRAGLDYWPYVDLTMHDSWEQYLGSRHPGRVWCLTKFGERIYHEAEFGVDDALVFGSETSGLSEEFVAQVPPEQRLVIPMECPEVRSLNLSNAVSVVLYEARRQLKMDRHVFRRRGE